MCYLRAGHTFSDLPDFWKSIKNRKDRRLQSWPLEKRLLNFQKLDILYGKSYSKFDGFWRLSLNLVFFFESSTLKSSIFSIFLSIFKNPEDSRRYVQRADNTFTVYRLKMKAIGWQPPVNYCQLYFPNIHIFRCIPNDIQNLAHVRANLKLVRLRVLSEDFIKKNCQSKKCVAELLRS